MVSTDRPQSSRRSGQRSHISFHFCLAFRQVPERFCPTSVLLHVLQNEGFYVIYGHCRYWCGECTSWRLRSVRWYDLERLDSCEFFSSGFHLSFKDVRCIIVLSMKADFSSVLLDSSVPRTIHTTTSAYQVQVRYRCGQSS